MSREFSLICEAEKEEKWQKWAEWVIEMAVEQLKFIVSSVISKKKF